MAHQAIQDRRTSLEFMRPRILASHDPARVLREIVRECCASACRGVRVDLLHQFFVVCCAHGKHLRLIASPTMTFGASFFQSIVHMIYIHFMNLNSLDLNLLVALDALLLDANVSRAAMRIGLSQPATSHALQRLREALRDPLLVRVGARMELTPRALALRGPLAQTLDQVRSLFIRDDFDAARSERQFRLMMPDLAVELLMPWLMEKITALAPNVRLDIV